MNALAVYIFAAIIGTTQLALGAYVWYSKREKTKAEATQITANSFSTLTDTITKMATDFSGTLIKTIELVNSREKRIDELEADSRTKGNDLEDLRRHFTDITAAAAARETEIALLKDSLVLLQRANENQAKDIVQLQARVLGLQDDSKRKDDELLKRDGIIREKDSKILQLEERVKHLEEEVERLKNPPPVTEEKVVETKPTT